LGPFVGHSIERAEATDSLRQSGWERGVVGAARFVDNNRGGFGALLAVAFGAVGALVVHGDWPLRAIAGAGIGLGVAWLVPTVHAAIGALVAPRFQRNEARQRVREWEAFFRADEMWQARSRLAYSVNTDVAWQTMYIQSQSQWTPADVSAEWKSRFERVIAGLRSLGDTKGAALLEARIGEFDGQVDVATINKTAASIANTLLNHSHGERKPPPERQ
jgi:hypothetical protein